MSFPFATPFLPLVKADDYIKFLPEDTFKGKTYRIIEVEPIQPFILDFLQISGALPSGVTALAVAGAANSSTSSLGDDIIRQFLETDINIFAQWRVEPLDDILLQLGVPGIQNVLYGTPVATTFIQRRLPQHRSRTQMTAVQATDVVLWANTFGTLIGALTRGQTPTRKSRIVGLHVNTTGAVNIFFGDGATAGGATASLTNHIFALRVTAAGDGGGAD